MNIKKLITVGIMTIAAFAAFAEPEVTDVATKHRYPWDGEEASLNEETRIAKDAKMITRRYLGGEDGVKLNVAFLNDQVALEVDDE